MCALLISLAFAIMLTTGCLCSCKKFFVNDGACVFSVLSNGIFKFSNTSAILLAAHICGRTLVSLSIAFSKLFSSLINCCFNECAFSTSTRTPLNLMSTRHGNRSVSNSIIDCRSCAMISFFISCHKPYVASASLSA